MKCIRTPLDEEYDKVLKEVYDKLLAVNQKAVKKREEDIKFGSCYILEILTSIMENRGKAE